MRKNVVQSLIHLEHNLSNLYTFATVKKIEIDCTSYCNAFCGACDRNIDGGADHPKLVLQHLTWDSWRSLVTEQNLQHINEIIFNGNFGDFSMHPKIISMLDYLSTVKSEIYINMHTNGTARSTTFWRELAEVLQKFSKHDIKWGIDGLADTHHIYRRGLDWNKRIDNLTAFNDAGGNSIWKCIVFDYNKSQLNTINELAEKLGCMAFQTNRNRSGTITMPAYKSFPSTTISSPTLQEFESQYKMKQQFHKQLSTPASTSVAAHGNTKCPYAHEGMIQIDPWGNVWPCCYISGRRVDSNTNFPFDKFSTKVSEHSLSDILYKFSEFLEPAWANASVDICNRCAGISQPAPRYS